MHLTTYLIRKYNLTLKWQYAVTIFIAISYFYSCTSTKNKDKMNASDFPEHVNQVIDTASGLECYLTILQGANGGASEVVVKLYNPSKNHDVILKVNTVTSAFVMVTVTDEQGNVLSKPAKKFNSSKTQKFVLVRIEAASSQEWCVPITNQLPVNNIPEQGMKGRLVVNVALLFRKTISDKLPSDADFQNSLLTLYDLDIFFLRTDLRRRNE